MTVTIPSEAREVFAIIDRMDVAALAGLFADGANLVFANTEPLVGPEQIRSGTQGFFDTIAGLHHTILNEWTIGADTIVQLKVIYDRHDGQQVTIPVVSIWHRDAAGKIDDYRVYFDLAPVYA